MHHVAMCILWLVFEITDVHSATQQKLQAGTGWLLSDVCKLHCNCLAVGQFPDTAAMGESLLACLARGC